MISFLFDVFFEIAKILSFILADTINDGKRTVAMIGDAIGRLDVGFAKASIFEILVIALILTLGFWYGIKFAAGNAKVIISVLAVITVIFFILILLL